MTDYNDGQWHGWNGGECPVHPKSMVDYVWHAAITGKTGVWVNMPAGYEVPWKTKVIRFRVITPYVEKQKPREVWINEYPWGTRGVHDSEAAATKARGTSLGKTTRWIEVLE